jgi:hypothetical protein
MMFRRSVVVVAAAFAFVFSAGGPATVRAAAPAASGAPANSPAPASPGVAASPVLQQFTKEDDAQKYCPHDEVVYLIPSYKVYFQKGEGLYGKTKLHAYACLKEAETFGYRLSEYGHGLRNH